LPQRFSKTQYCYLVHRFSYSASSFRIRPMEERETHPEILLSFIRIFFFTSSTSAE